MEENVLEIDRQIEDDDRGNDADPGRECQQVEQAPPACLGNEGKPDGRGRNTTRTRSVFSATTPRLFGHRQPRPIDCFRRGWMTSQSAMATNTAPKAPRRMYGS